MSVASMCILRGRHSELRDGQESAFASGSRRKYAVRLPLVAQLDRRSAPREPRVMPEPPRFLDLVRTAVRTRHYSFKREEVRLLRRTMKRTPRLVAAMLYGGVFGFLGHCKCGSRAFAARELAWQSLFPASRLAVDSRSGIERRHHLDESRCSEQSKRRCGRIHKHAGCHNRGTRSPRTFSKMATISGRFRNSSATRT
jgi:hypothetical protein